MALVLKLVADSFMEDPYVTWKTMSSSDATDCEKKRLTPAQFARVERNKERAVLLRKARLAKKPYHNRTVVQPAIDSGAGFLVDPDEEQEESNLRLVETAGLPVPFLWQYRKLTHFSRDHTAKMLYQAL